MGEAFLERRLGRLNMAVRLLSGADKEDTKSVSYVSFGGGEAAGENADNGASQPISEPVSIFVEESSCPDEGRNPYIALGWYSLTEDLPALRARVSGAGEVEMVGGGGGVGGGAETAAPSKVVVCLGGGPTCNIEFERACSEGVDSVWYCLYLPPRQDEGGGATVTERGPELQSSVNAAHSEEAEGLVELEEWRFGGKIYQTNKIKKKI